MLFHLLVQKTDFLEDLFFPHLAKNYFFLKAIYVLASEHKLEVVDLLAERLNHFLVS